MFTVNNNPLLADELAVLEELKTQLAINGVQLFAEFKRSTQNIQFNCPMHSNGQERKPSCGITLEAKGEIPAGTVHCFTCGYTATLEEMVSHCFGRDDLGRFGREWLIRNFLTVSVESRKPITLNLSRKDPEAFTSFIQEEELAKYRFYHPYMYKRKLTDDVIDQFDVGFDANFRLFPKASPTPCITFPVRDMQGNTLFIGRRSVNSKMFHYPEGVNKPVYGLYELPKEADEVIVCESMINALTCYVYGRPAVALLGLGTDYQYQQLKQLGARKLIVALDGDSAGRKATLRLKKKLSGIKLITHYELPEGKDINDLTKEEFENLQELF